MYGVFEYQSPWTSIRMTSSGQCSKREPRKPEGCLFSALSSYIMHHVISLLMSHISADFAFDDRISTRTSRRPHDLSHITLASCDHAQLRSLGSCKLQEA